MIARLARPALLLAATAALGACTAYDGFGYGGVSVGVSSGGYYPHRYSPYSYYGWYDGFYYPGAGYYVYDDYGRRHRWSDRHRHYWEGRRDGRRDHGENWDGYRRDRDGRYHDGNRDGNRGDYSRGRDGDGRDWQRRDRDDRQGDGRNWQRRDRDRDEETSRGRDGRRDGNRAGNRQGNPQIAPQRPSRPEVSRPRPNATSDDAPRVRPRESRGGRPSADRGREFRRGSQD
jgi:hypothetical protein